MFCRIYNFISGFCCVVVMWVRRLFDLGGNSPKTIGLNSTWYLGAEGVEPRDFYWNECKEKHIMEKVKFECQVGEGIKIIDTGTLHCSKDRNKYDIDSYFLNFGFKVSMEMHSKLYQAGMPDPTIKVLVTNSQLKEGISDGSPEIIADIMGHNVDELVAAAKRLKLPLEDRVKPNHLSVEQIMARKKIFHVSAPVAA